MIMPSRHGVFCQGRHADVVPSRWIKASTHILLERVIGDAPQESERLVQAVTAACEAAGLQAVPALVSKCLQLQETLAVRFGVMLVGPAGVSLLAATASGSCGVILQPWQCPFRFPLCPGQLTAFTVTTCYCKKPGSNRRVTDMIPSGFIACSRMSSCMAAFAGLLTKKYCIRFGKVRERVILTRAFPTP